MNTHHQFRFIPIILVLGSIGSCMSCGRAEYRIGDECCLHCTEFTTTFCVSCIDSTFLDEPSGLMKCAPCSSCDSGLGLKVKQPCRPSSDTVCGTLEGFYCLDPNKDGCRIRHTGTTSTDTVCADCAGKTYSNGSLTYCQPHTECEFLEIELGTSWLDSECGVASLPTAGITAGVLIFFLLIGTIAGVCLFLVKTRQNLGKITFDMLSVPFIVFIACDISVYPVKATCFASHLVLITTVCYRHGMFITILNICLFYRPSNTDTGMFGNILILFITLYY
uniref:TNFR-Cys domain-containing protein n=1 Tax=Hucho hucho TaxID=62062 RepID=A0A4W5JTZ0_9TELE